MIRLSYNAQQCTVPFDVLPQWMILYITYLRYTILNFTDLLNMLGRNSTVNNFVKKATLVMTLGVSGCPQFIQISHAVNLYDSVENTKTNCLKLAQYSQFFK